MNDIRQREHILHRKSGYDSCMAEQHIRDEVVITNEGHIYDSMGNKNSNVAVSFLI